MKQRLAYSLGAFGHSVFYVMLSTYFMVFVTSSMVTGVSKSKEAELIGIITGLIVIIRLVEVVFDPIIGGIIDNTRTRFGKFKPWIVIGGVVSSGLLVILFTNLFGLATSNETLFLIVFTVLFFLLDCFYSFKDIAFWSMIPALSTNSEEREKLATTSTLGASIGGNVVNITVVPIVTMFTFILTGTHTQGASGWFVFALIVAIIAGGTSVITAVYTSENESIIRTQNEKHTIKEIFKAILQNDQLLWFAIAYILYSIANVTTTAVLFYYFKYVLGMPGEFWLVGVIAGILGFVMIPLFPLFTKLLTRRGVFIGGVLTMMLSYGFFILGQGYLPVIIVGIVLFYFPQQLVFLASLMTITDTVEYGQWKNGVRNEAVTLSLRPLLDKASGALSNGIVGIIAVSAGMTGNTAASSITTHGMQMFKLYAFYLPALLMLISIGIFLLKVKLTEKKHAEIVAELEKKLSVEN